MADPATARIDVFAYDKLRGLSDRTGPGVLQPIAATAEFIGVGDVLLDGRGLPEIVVVDRPTGDLWLYRYEGSTLTYVDGYVGVGNVTGMAIGDVVGTGQSDIALTTTGPDQLVILTEDSEHHVALGASIATLSSPRGPSIGDVWSGGANEIVVVNAGEAANTVSVFSTAGTQRDDFAGDAAVGQAPTASSVGNVLTGPGRAGSEVLVTYADPIGESRLDVFAPDGGTILGSPQGYDVGTRYNPQAITSADVNGDGVTEAILANSGSFTRDGNRQRASVQVYSADTTGTALLDPQTKWAGGAEMAGGTASVVAADAGPVGAIEHPIGAVANTHVSTETATLTRHVECADCHDSHAADETTASAPAAPGPIKGAWGVAVRNDSTRTVTLTQQQGVRYEYELCLKCHSAWSDPRREPRSRFAREHAERLGARRGGAVGDGEHHGRLLRVRLEPKTRSCTARRATRARSRVTRRVRTARERRPSSRVRTGA